VPASSIWVIVTSTLLPARFVRVVAAVALTVLSPLTCPKVMMVAASATGAKASAAADVAARRSVRIFATNSRVYAR